MRDADREIIEEAIRNSGAGGDFDEMLLRATKRHLPRMYHRQFSVILEQVIAEADALGAGNRAAAQSLVRKAAAVQAVPMPAGPPADVPPAPQPPKGPSEAPPVPKARGTVDELLDNMPEPKEVPAAERPDGPAGKPEEPGAPGETAGGSVEKLPEEQKILDLGGTSPESLSPEMREKLGKLVKAQKRRQEWTDERSAEEPDPGLFFKGQQRAPPAFVPLTKPPKKEPSKDGPAGQAEEPGEEEDLE